VEGTGPRGTKLPEHLALLGTGPAPMPGDLAARVQAVVDQDRGALASLRALPTRTRGLLAAGLIAALTGNLALQLHCPASDPMHLVLGHATVVLPFLALEAVARLKS
jgi:hypothetical protein